MILAISLVRVGGVNRRSRAESLETAFGLKRLTLRYNVQRGGKIYQVKARRRAHTVKRCTTRTQKHLPFSV